MVGQARACFHHYVNIRSGGVGLDNILAAITPIHPMIQCSMATTERYLRLTITNLKEAHTKLHPREKESAAL